MRWNYCTWILFEHDYFSPISSVFDMANHSWRSFFSIWVGLKPMVLDLILETLSKNRYPQKCDCEKYFVVAPCCALTQSFLNDIWHRSRYLLIIVNEIYSFYDVCSFYRKLETNSLIFLSLYRSSNQRPFRQQNRSKKQVNSVFNMKNSWMR